MNKIEKLHESIRALFRTEGEKFCYTPGEIEQRRGHLLCG